MIAVVFKIAVISIVGYILFASIGNKHYGQLILIMGIILVVNVSAKGCAPYIDKVQGWVDTADKAQKQIEQTQEQIDKIQKPKDWYKWFMHELGGKE